MSPMIHAVVAYFLGVTDGSCMIFDDIIEVDESFAILAVAGIARKMTLDQDKAHPDVLQALDRASFRTTAMPPAFAEVLPAGYEDQEYDLDDEVQMALDPEELFEEEQEEAAMEAITKAHLYNRNDRQVIALLKEIYLLNGRTYDDTWAFIPQCEITRVSESKISIKYNC